MNEKVAQVASHSRTRGLWFFFLLALTNLIWAGQGTAVKYLDQDHLGPMAITFLPFYVATLLLLPLLFWERRANPTAVQPSGRDWLRFAVAGVFGQVPAQLGMTWGISRSLASNGAILNLLIPVFSAVLASFMLRERLSPLRIVSLLIGLVGVLLLSVTDLRESSFLATSYFAGNLLILCGCAGSSFYNVYCKGLLARFREVEILVFSYITASLASLPVLFHQEPNSFRTLSGITWQGWLAFGFLAIFMYTVSMLLFFYVLEHLPVTVASASLYLVPVFGVLLAAAFLGERLSGIALAGAGIVLASTVLVMRYDNQAQT